MTRREWTTRCARQPDGTVTDYGTKSDHIGDANKKANEPTGPLFACDTCDAQTDDPWHYSTPTNRHMHACDICWPQVQLIMLAETKQALLSRRGVPPEDMAAAIQLEDEA